MTDRSATLRVTEIFHSLQGESSRAGLPTVFVRLTGCPLRCTWCDTEYAFTGGETMTLGEVLIEVARHGARQVCVTGGEPLAQKACLPLLGALCDAGYSVSLETSGALDVCRCRRARLAHHGPQGAGLRRGGQEPAGRTSPCLNAQRRNQDRAGRRGGLRLGASRRSRHGDSMRSARCCSRRWPGKLDPKQLAEWVLRDRLPVRVQLQLHKLIWGAERGR